MPAGEFREMTDDEMILREAELRREVFNLRFQLATGQSENPMRVRKVKRDLARLLTVRRERQIGLSAAKRVAGGRGAVGESDSST